MAGKLREIRHRELKAAIQEGIDSEDAGSIEGVVARNRARRANRQDEQGVRIERILHGARDLGSLL